MIIEALTTKQEYLNHKADSRYIIKPISIKDAIDGRPYFCKDCGTTLFTRRPINKEHSFVHAKGKPHTEDICRARESERQTPTANVKSFNVKEFFYNMIDVIRLRFLNEHNIDNDEDLTEEDNWPIWDDENNSDDNQDTDNTPTITEDTPLDIEPTPVDDDKDDRNYIESLSPIRAVKHVIDCGYERYDPDIIINDTYNIKVRDLIYSVPIHDEFFANPNSLDSLNRIVEMKPVTIIHEDNRFEGRSYILAKIFHYNKEKKLYDDDIYFRLFIHQEDIYWDIYNKFFTKVGKEHTFVSKYNSIFVINHWTISNMPNSFKGENYTTYDADIYDYKKQIYAPTSYKNKKAK